ncbi:hypothetical protein ACWIG5_26395 [Streptomyces lydicus]
MAQHTHHPAPPVHPVDATHRRARHPARPAPGGFPACAGALVAVPRNLFFPHLGTRSTSRAAALSAARPGSGTHIP